MRFNAVITYSDVRGRQTELSEKELAWFQSLVEKANTVTGNRIEIVPYDFDLFSDADAEYSLGRTYTKDPDHQLSEAAGTQIVIDTWHIHESYDVTFNGGYALPGEPTLEETIAHEIAHTHIWSHEKAHADLTQKYLAAIQAA